MAAQQTKQNVALGKIDLSTHGTFEEPKKKIHDAADVAFFLSSKACTDIVTFLLQLNASMFPRREGDGAIQSSPETGRLQTMLSDINKIIDEAPPEPGPRRFGNVAFRKWSSLSEANADALLQQYLPESITTKPEWQNSDESPLVELKSYLLGSFGSSQRLDYGTGHELSFLAFLGCIWKLGGFTSCNEREIVLQVIVPYLDLVRRLIITYNLEPAGSHGVWGLDDHSFVPYVFGSAQFSPVIVDVNHIPQEGSLPGAPDPGDVTKQATVEKLRASNLYFGAIGFIYDVKKGPFWEHSPMLYDISGVKAGWAKINKGMIKMYIAEVLSKFPVVQHFPFGSMFKWERDANASGPMFAAPLEGGQRADASARSQAQAQPPLTAMPLTAAPLASPPASTTAQMPPPLRAPWVNASAARAPPNTRMQAPLRNPTDITPHGSASSSQAPTKAPWAK